LASTNDEPSILKDKKQIDAADLTQSKGSG